MFSDLAWAPTAEANVLAMIKSDDGASDLCFGAIGGDGMETRCKDEPDNSIERKINWAPDGKSILGLGLQGRHDRVRHGPLEDEEAVLGRPGRLVQGRS